MTARPIPLSLGARAAQLRLLAPLLVRVVPWRPAVLALAAAVALVGWKAPAVEGAGGVSLMRGVGVLLAFGLAFALDDAAAETLAPSPFSLPWRRAVRVAAALLLAGVSWAGTAVYVAARVPGLPWAALTLEALALVALTLAAAAVASQWWSGREAGVVAGPVVLVALLGALRLPRDYALFVLPGPGWAEAHVRWGLLLAAATVLLVLTSRDPAARAFSARRGDAR